MIVVSLRSRTSSGSAISRGAGLSPPPRAGGFTTVSRLAVAVWHQHPFRRPCAGALRFLGKKSPRRKSDHRFKAVTASLQSSCLFGRSLLIAVALAQVMSRARHHCASLAEIIKTGGAKPRFLQFQFQSDGASYASGKIASFSCYHRFYLKKSNSSPIYGLSLSRDGLLRGKGTKTQNGPARRIIFIAGS